MYFLIVIENEPFIVIYFVGQKKFWSSWSINCCISTIASKNIPECSIKT